MSKAEVAMMLPEIEGYEYTGEYRNAGLAEPYLYDWQIYAGPTIVPYPILKKKPKRRAKGEAYWRVFKEDWAYHAGKRIEEDGYFDDMLFDSGNYFLSELAAKSAARKVNEVFNNNKEFLNS